MAVLNIRGFPDGLMRAIDAAAEASGSTKKEFCIAKLSEATNFGPQPVRNLVRFRVRDDEGVVSSQDAASEIAVADAPEMMEIPFCPKCEGYGFKRPMRLRYGRLWRCSMCAHEEERP
ncbi:MAG TPA: hypothetical protein VFW94_23395 [Candidatus Acidoferrales bacterium]|nr:hypothetical protein [Candidatus Acidoferrales bacterium]